MEGPQTVQEDIARFEAEGDPAMAEIIRFMRDREAFAKLVDQLPHAIEAGSAFWVIFALKLWGTGQGLYPPDRFRQALLHAITMLPSKIDGEAQRT